MVQTDVGEARFVGRYGIQTLDVGRIFDHGLWLIRDNAVVLAITAVMLPFPLACIRSAITLYGETALPEIASTTPDMTAFLVLYGAIMFANVFMVLVELPITYAAFTYLLCRSYLGHNPTLKETLKSSIRLYLPIAVILFLRVVATSVGVCLAFVGALIASVVFSVAISSYVVERRGIVNAIERSFRLCWANFFQVFLVIMALGFFSAQGAILGALKWVPWLFIPLSGVYSSFLYAVDVAACVALYFSLRSKQEAYDLELMAEVIDTNTMEQAAL